MQLSMQHQAILKCGSVMLLSLLCACSGETAVDGLDGCAVRELELWIMDSPLICACFINLAWKVCIKFLDCSSWLEAWQTPLGGCSLLSPLITDPAGNQRLPNHQ